MRLAIGAGYTGQILDKGRWLQPDAALPSAPSVSAARRCQARARASEGSAGECPTVEERRQRRTHGPSVRATLLVFHEVDDVDHWLASPKREEFFGPLGMNVRTFRDPAGSNRVGLIFEVPDIAAWEAALKTRRGG